MKKRKNRGPANRLLCLGTRMLQRKDLVDDFGAPYGVFHIQDPESSQTEGMCYTSSRKHLDKLRGTPELILHPYNREMKVCQNCLAAYRKEKKEEKMVKDKHVIDGETYIREGSIPKLEGTYRVRKVCRCETQNRREVEVCFQVTEFPNISPGDEIIIIRKQE